jgi:hypothetical protein
VFTSPCAVEANLYEVALHPKGGASTPNAAGRRRPSDRRAICKQIARSALPLVLVVVPLGILLALKGPQVGAALAGCPPAALIAAVVAHVGSLSCRCEAWRLAVNAIDCRPLPRVSVHAASCVGFAAGSLQGASTAPVRAVALRRIARKAAPRFEHALVAEAPVFAIDAALTAIVLAFAVAVAPVAPVWTPVAAVAISLAAIAGLWQTGRRFGHRPVGAGLQVLADAKRRLPLAGLVGATVVMGLARAWIILAAFGLPAGAASVAILFVVLGAFGSFPIGPSSTPGATLALFGATDATAAMAAGIALSATSLLAVAVYAALAGAVLGVTRIPPFGAGRRSISSVDQPKRRAASPSPVSGL